MNNARRHPRFTNVHGFRARFGSGEDSRGVERVVNVSEGGMLVADDTLDVGQQTEFELSGPSFHYAGVAEVVHLTNETTGLRFLSWHDHDNRPIRSMIEQLEEWHTPAEESRPNQPVIRRVAVLTGPRRNPPPETPSPPAGRSPDG
jgi:PilZ domain